MVAKGPLFVDTGGRPRRIERPTLVFVHGALQDHACWLLQSRWFAHHGYNVIAPDLPGHGRSAGPPLVDATAAADWLMQLVGEHTESDIALIGHSMGSLIALEAAARAPALVRRLVMLGTAVPMPVAPALLEAARVDEPKAMALINQWCHSPRAIGAGGHGLWLPGLNLRIMERQKPGVLYNDLAACNAYTEGPAAMARLACPVTVIAGSADRMTSVKAARRFIAALQENPAAPANLVELPGIGHALMAEAPADVRAALFEAISVQH